MKTVKKMVSMPQKGGAKEERDGERRGSGG